MTATQPELTLGELQAAYGGRIERGQLHDATVLGQTSWLYLVKDRVYCGATKGPYERRAIGAHVSMVHGLPLQASHEHGLGLRTPVATNDNSPDFAINPAEWADQPVPERRWYIPHLIPSRQVTILSGDGGLGKSLLALQLSVASALSTTTLGLEPAAGPALYVGAEDEADEFHRRMADVLKDMGGGFSELDKTFRLIPLADRDALLSIPTKAGVMEPTELWNQVAELARKFRPGIIVLDTSADLFGGDEIKRGQVRQFIAMLRGLAMELDCAALLLSHPSVAGINTGTGASGSTAWNNSVRSRLYLARAGGDDADPDLRILTTMKANYGRPGGAIRMRWQEGVFVVDDGKTSPAAGLQAKRSQDMFLTLLSAINRTGDRVASTKGTNYAPAIMAEHPNASGVTKKQFESSMRKLLADGLIKVKFEGPPSRQRQRLIVSAEDFGPGGAQDE